MGWLLAIFLEHMSHLSGPGFGELSPLTNSRVSWNVEDELGCLLVLAARYLADVGNCNIPIWRTLAPRGVETIRPN